MSAIAFDLRHPEAVAHELEEANRRLARETEVPDSIIELVHDVSIAISEADATAVAAIDPYVWIQVQAAALRAQHAAHLTDEREQRRAVRIALEELRFLFARLAERVPVAEDQPVKEVLQWLDVKLSVSQRRKADLLGVGDRTYQRWISPQESGEPEGQQELRARVVARITAQLRHVLTGPGVVDWFETPLADLDGAKPIDLLADASETERLLELAVTTRSLSAA
jgi:uncharacterized protein (DUF2384 family)